MKSYMLFHALCILMLVAIAAGTLTAPAHAVIQPAGTLAGETPDITPVI